MAAWCPHVDLAAVFVNTSLKKDAKASHTMLLLESVQAIMEKQGVDVDVIHLVEHTVAPGIQADMTKEGWDRDDWPDLWKRILLADILVIGTPIWLGEESSECRKLIERLYAMSGELNDKGQSIYYGKVAGMVVTGNEDGIKHIGMSLTYGLQHLGYTIPPQADCGWIGEAGPGPSYGDEKEGGRIGFDNKFTQHNATIMAWNLIHLARIIKAAGGYPREGNDRNAWDDGERFGFEQPDRVLP